MSLVVPEYAPFEAQFAYDITAQKYFHDIPAQNAFEGVDNFLTIPARKETWGELSLRVAREVMSVVPVREEVVQEIAGLIAQKKFIPGGRYLYASGREWHQVQNCVLTRVEDSSEGWADHMTKATASLMSGAGLGTVYTDLRSEGTVIKRKGGVSTGPLALMQMTNEAGRGIMQGGARRSAIWAGLHWNHADVMKFIHMKDWPPEIRALKAKDFNFPAPMDHTNISVILDTLFFEAYNDPSHPDHKLAVTVYWEVIRQMCKTGEPGFSVDCGVNEGENLRNACCEITSADDSDICNLGSINLARIKDGNEMQGVLELATMFLLAGTVYSDIPYPKIGDTRTKNRRLGLGLMGIHEWLLMRGKRYGPDDELGGLLSLYEGSTDIAWRYADAWNISRPVKTRAIAPTGSIAIAAETTSGVEPLFTAAMKRRYLKGKSWAYQYIIDGCAMRLINNGVDPDSIEDAYTIGAERRVAFQAWVQQYVDHAISSTINLPAWGSETNNSETVRDFGNMLMKYLPKLRGITTYPDGARGGQPLNPVRVKTAMKHLGQTFEENGEPTVAIESVDACDISKGGQCGA